MSASWVKPHRKAEGLADMAARVALYDEEEAGELYRLAAEYEWKAYHELRHSHLLRTRGILAVSAIALYLKARAWRKAWQSATEMLQAHSQEVKYQAPLAIKLPEHAIRGLQEMIAVAERHME